MHEFNLAMLRLARKARGLTQTELSDLLEINQATLSRIETEQLSGEAYVSQFAKALNFPDKFFFLEGNSFRSNTYFYRKRNTSEGKELVIAEALMNIVKMNIERLLISIDLNELRLPKWDVEKNGSPTMYARYIREHWKIPQGRIDNLTQLAEDNGIVVIHLDFGSSKFDGLSIFTKDDIPIIFLNKGMPGDRMRLTLAHEIGHLGMHFGIVTEASKEIESEAYEFASELLIPEDEIRSEIYPLNLQKLADLKRYWKVSMGAILEKTKNRKLIKTNTYRYLITKFRKNNYHIEEPSALKVAVEKPNLVKDIIEAHKTQLGYTKRELLDLLCISNEDFTRFYETQMPRFKVIRNKESE